MHFCLICIPRAANELSLCIFGTACWNLRQKTLWTAFAYEREHNVQVEEKELDANKVHKAMQNIAAAQKADKEAQRVR